MNIERQVQKIGGISGLKLDPDPNFLACADPQTWKKQGQGRVVPRILLSLSCPAFVSFPIQSSYFSVCRKRLKGFMSSFVFYDLLNIYFNISQIKFLHKCFCTSVFIKIGNKCIRITINVYSRNVFLSCKCTKYRYSAYHGIRQKCINET